MCLTAGGHLSPVHFCRRPHDRCSHFAFAPWRMLATCLRSRLSGRLIPGPHICNPPLTYQSFGHGLCSCCRTIHVYLNVIVHIICTLHHPPHIFRTPLWKVQRARKTTTMFRHNFSKSVILVMRLQLAALSVQSFTTMKPFAASAIFEMLEDDLCRKCFEL